MDWKKLAPNNWFRNEQKQDREQRENLGRMPARQRPERMPDSTAPDHPIAALHDEMERLFDDVARRFGMPMAPSGGSLIGGAPFRPQVDIKESRKHYTLLLDMPGVDRDDVSIEVEGDALVVKGEKKEEREDDEENYHFVERHYGAFQRVLNLPDDADPNDVKAKFRNGVLNIRVGRTEKPREDVRRIEVE